ncbi:Metallo-hydrolase/oxidoreductase [Glarea lozoyensis ATCC 20868]|uniref:Metallo-hydrolase/oxidoreductase n=1 Tax=Glarea lozoyensis (strain ATCC 20868 / MF5171) TaxID=1116229 RepID=S3D8L2_GLAL2|nr:Metallo-hydrolase/oxidoreductase [Glarea lozoyensis ATCC 20868]EPE28336.1 Metallo-hydrolase/oxidoreductase [Glarea lozoyensis ATCC 20868]
MASPNNKNTITITHITAATTILNINGINFLTDPVFCPASTYDGSHVFQKMPEAITSQMGGQIPPPPHLISLEGPALQLQDLPPIDAILLSHEDHADNLDPEGRKLLDGRRVFTTSDGAKNLAPRPGVVALKPWETIEAVIGGTTFKMTGTPCQHIPGGEVTGFVLETESFGVNSSGLPNAIWISGDTVYLDELVEIGKKWHIQVAQVHLGKAVVPMPSGPVQMSMDGRSAIDLVEKIGADVMVPVHFESWEHFTEGGEDLAAIVKEREFGDRVRWLTPGVAKVVAEF